MKKGGFKNYKTTIAYMRKFLASKYEKADIYLLQINMEFASEYERYIRNSLMKTQNIPLGI